MSIAFYTVDNHLNYGRHEFDAIWDNPDEICEKIAKLNDDELRVYDLSTAYQSPGPNVCDFMEDYNDELLDGGWWCVIIPNRK